MSGLAILKPKQTQNNDAIRFWQISDLELVARRHNSPEGPVCYWGANQRMALQQRKRPFDVQLNMHDNMRSHVLIVFDNSSQISLCLNAKYKFDHARLARPSNASVED